MYNYEILIFAWNIVTLLVYGFDKMRARKGGKRIRERLLLLNAYLLGGIGAAFGMILFNHKTSKMKFRLLVPLAVIINVAVIFAARRYII